MPFIALLIGAILIVVAFNGTHGQLATNLEKDVPGFSKWLFAIVAIAAIGYIPGLEKPSRWLLGLVAAVVILAPNGAGQKIIQGIQQFTQTGQQTAQQSAQSEQQAAQSAAATAQQEQTAMAALGGSSGSAGSSNAMTQLAAGLSNPLNAAMLGAIV
jgi:hypothetical protein